MWRTSSWLIIEGAAWALKRRVVANCAVLFPPTARSSHWSMICSEQAEGRPPFAPWRVIYGVTYETTPHSDAQPCISILSRSEGMRRGSKLLTNLQLRCVQILKRADAMGPHAVLRFREASRPSGSMPRSTHARYQYHAPSLRI